MLLTHVHIHADTNKFKSIIRIVFPPFNCAVQSFPVSELKRVWISLKIKNNVQIKFDFIYP